MTRILATQSYWIQLKYSDRLAWKVNVLEFVYNKLGLGKNVTTLAQKVGTRHWENHLAVEGIFSSFVN